jgi:hypothetical protein
MVFTRIGSVVAALALVLGLLISAMGYLVGLGSPAPTKLPSLAIYRGQNRRARCFDKALYSMRFGIALGVLTEIRWALEPRPYVYERRS